MKYKKWSFKNKVSGIILLLLSLGWILAPNDPFQQNLLLRLSSPSFQFPFGTDALGRCVLSRFLYGGRTTILLVLFVGVLILLTGTILGLIFGWYKGRFTFLTDGVLYLFTAFPPIVFVIAFVGNWGNGVTPFIYGLIFSGWSMVAKLVKTLVEDEKNKAYVASAIVANSSRPRLLLIHILPNIGKSILTYISLCCADMILLTVGFSYIGVTMGDHVIHWGELLLEYQNLMNINGGFIWLISGAIFISTLTFHLQSEDLERR